MEIPKRRGNTPFDVPPGFHDHRVSSDVSLFSTSLPVLRHPNSSYTDASQGGVEDTSTSVNVLNQDAEVKAVHDDLDLHVVGSMLPDDEDLLAGITDDFDLSAVQNQLDYLEDDDVFGSGGGLEMDSDPTEGFMVSMARTGMTDGYIGNGVAYGLQNGVGAVAGEHPYGEHPSRTLFVRNINSNVEDSELRSLFEQYGDIRTIYTPCKHRGFVMISYYDIRDARTAMRSLQNKPLRRRKLDIHFSIPKENPSDKDMNQGTLVVFNLDASVSNDDLRLIFGAYGEVKEIRETPNKRHHKFIEFYDVRAAEAALKALNRSDIAGKRIKLEPSRPGGARRNLMNQLSHELEQDEHRSIRHHVGSPLSGSPPGLWGQFGSPADTSQLHGLSQSPTLGSSLPGLASILPPLSNSIKIPPIGKDHGKITYADRARSGLSSTRGHFFQHSHSLPDQSTGLLSNMKNSPGSLASFGYETSTTAASALSTLTGPQFLWGSPNLHSEQSRPPAWHRASSGHSLTSSRQGQGFPYSRHHNSFSTPSGSYFRHNVGSAPSVVPLERHFRHVLESPETSFMNHGAFAGVGFNVNDGSLIMNMNGCSVPISAGFSANMPENHSNGFRMTPPQRIGHLLNGGVTYSGLGSSGIEGFTERGRNRLVENNGGQIENKQQYQLQLDKIVSGEDTRTTLMIKNIPNKYTSKMLLVAIDENHRGTYDFVYLPIDFKNKCNVGYAFINMLSPSHIIPFYEDFNGKKWEKFNSEKVASLAYARIQGRPALVSHFENSSLMNEDKRCRPILFQAEVPEAAVKVPSSISNGNVQVREKDEIARDSAGILSVNTCRGAEMVDEPRSSNGYR